jgi:hypothetical protein
MGSFVFLSFLFGGFRFHWDNTQTSDQSAHLNGISAGMYHWFGSESRAERFPHGDEHAGMHESVKKPLACDLAAIINAMGC